MTVELSINRVRDEIFKLTEGGANRLRSTEPILAKIFNESFAQLLGEDDQLSWTAAGSAGKRDRREWDAAFQDHLYDHLIGPKLRGQMGNLQNRSEQVVAFWVAAKEMCRWITGFLWRGQKEKNLHSNQESGIKVLFDPGRRVSVKFQEKSWNDSVVLTDMHHLVLKIPGRYYCCIPNLELGDGNNAVDFVLACLYSQILMSRDPKASAAIALIGFKPDMEERFFSADDLKEPLGSLKAIVGRVAGVIPV